MVGRHEFYRIGGMNFRCSLPTCMAQMDALSHYQQFEQTSEEERGDSGFLIEIGEEPSSLPSLPESAEAFVSGAWRAHLVQGRCVAFDGLAFAPPQVFWRARLDESGGKASVWCDYRIQPDPEGVGETFVEPIFRVLIRNLLVEHLAGTGQGLLLHSAAVEIDGRMFLFAGHSGAGKSTTANLFARDKRVELVNDDRVLLLRRENGWSAAGTPWCGDLQVAENRTAPLGGVFFIEKGGENRSPCFTPMERREVVRRLMSVTTIPWYSEMMSGKALDLMQQLVVEEVPAVPFYRFALVPNGEAAEQFVAFARELV